MNQLKSIILGALFAAGLFSLTGCSGSSTPLFPASSTNTTYLVTLVSDWGAASNDAGIPTPPAMPHFSPLTAASHSNAVQFWTANIAASPGIEELAETGANAIFLDEIAQAVAAGTALGSSAATGPLFTPGVDTISIEVNEQFPLVTFAAMVAPSPDWFVGVHDVDMMDGGTEFVDQLVVTLFAYDAGTEEGLTFSIDNPDTVPAGVISLITDTNNPLVANGQPVPIGTLIFQRQ